ncbi:MAG TPA: uroporphyrinogen decarboxylase family protein [Candidatus Hydrogenedentes bacterium]|nr:uroporphyrinogen decarboxylase family protein [Candidatus Hydrogenedentota bacterium]
MTRRERLMATLRGECVDRPAMNFYELDGLTQNETNSDPYNVFSDSSWGPLLELVREKTDRIVMCGPGIVKAAEDPVEALTERETWEEDASRFIRTRIHAPGRILTSLTRRDRDIDTVWVVEHLLKDTEDLRAWVALPQGPFSGGIDPQPVLDIEAALGESGIAMIDTSDPLCEVGSLIDLATFTVLGMTENRLMHEALEKVASVLLPRTKAVAKALPGRLWRIYGPEYASPPYLPPNLFEEYAMRYVTPMVEAIQGEGGFARVHCHGRLKDILDHIAATGCVGLDPIEPPPQGDVELSYVRKHYGRQMVLFGNLEVSDIENMPTPTFSKRVARSLREGMEGSGRGFVLMPSSAPYGRKLPELTLRNYEEIVRLVEAIH